jgi:hypothetical protein
MITFDHYICALEQKLIWKQIRTRKKEHQYELIVSKKRKSCKENIKKTFETPKVNERA